jgi:3-deoxy-D-manno-octulosonate 8-phosphate phosphatase (KDO 8-P phosphatase)
VNVLELFKAIDTFVFDVDGVLTDGSLLIDPGNQYIRKMNIKDGYAMQYAVKRGYRIAVITGSHSEPVAERLAHLGITAFYQRESDKKSRLLSYMQDHQLKPEQVLYMGDDIPDYSVMQMVGLPCCPSDAASDIRGISRYISPFKGGEGCARDVIEKVLRLQGQWELDTSLKSI